MAKAKKGAKGETAADAVASDPTLSKDAGGAEHATNSTASVPPAPEPATSETPNDPRVEAESAADAETADKLRTRLGEPAPVTGAKVDPKTGRVEKAAPGTFDPTRRRPQTA